MKLRYWAAVFRNDVLAGIKLEVRILASIHRVAKLRQDVVSGVELRIGILGLIRSRWETSLWKKKRGRMGVLVGLPQVDRSIVMIMYYVLWRRFSWIIPTEVGIHDQNAGKGELDQD